jgi:hypothetical protein
MEFSENTKKLLNNIAKQMKCAALKMIESFPCGAAGAVSVFPKGKGCADPATDFVWQFKTKEQAPYDRL